MRIVIAMFLSLGLAGIGVGESKGVRKIDAFSQWIVTVDAVVPNGIYGTEKLKSISLGWIVGQNRVLIRSLPAASLEIAGAPAKVLGADSSNHLTMLEVPTDRNVPQIRFAQPLAKLVKVRVVQQNDSTLGTFSGIVPLLRPEHLGDFFRLPRDPEDAVDLGSGIFTESGEFISIAAERDPLAQTILIPSPEVVRAFIRRWAVVR